MPCKLRSASPDDVPVVLHFIRLLAEYEKLSHEVTASEDDLQRHLFGPDARAKVVLAEVEGAPIGFALYFHNFSTFLGKPGVYLEDLFVLPQHRGCGYGKALLIHLAQIAVEQGCGRFEWAVLDWNEPSIRFYRSLGATPMSDWTTFRVTGESLERLGAPGGFTDEVEV